LRIPAAVVSKFFEKQLPWDFQLSTNEDSILINTQREILKLRKDVFFEKSVSLLGNQVVRSPFFRAVRKEDHVEIIGMRSQSQRERGQRGQPQNNRVQRPAICRGALSFSVGLDAGGEA
jgi:hypothetical protein